MHKKPLTPLEHEGLRLHGLDIGTPSQLSDCFRHGVAWALESMTQLTAERDSALAQNAELVAQVEVLSKSLKNQLNDCINFDGGKLTDSIMEHSCIILKSTPTQHLRDRDAEVGRAGFVAGYERCWRDAVGSRVPEFVVPFLSNEYAERVKAGEV